MATRSRVHVSCSLMISFHLSPICPRLPDRFCCVIAASSHPTLCCNTYASTPMCVHLPVLQLKRKERVGGQSHRSLDTCEQQQRMRVSAIVSGASCQTRRFAERDAVTHSHGTLRASQALKLS